MIDYTFLLIGLIYATFLPGFTVTELFLPKLAFWKKIPLYFILSVVISSYFSYFAALIFGFTRVTLLGCFLVFLSLFIYMLIRKRIRIGDGLRKIWPVILTGILIYVIYFTALIPAIFKLHNGYFVMSGPNWQDTAMHLSIIQSLTQGNFPPQAPYFSGQPLTYYYFSDLHAAIVNTILGKFFPEILILLNPFFAMTFFFSVFALSYQVTKKKIFSVISGIAVVFYGNLGFINLIKEMLSRHINYFALVTSNPFNFDTNYFQMTPMSDYFLQNRPMMVGLPAFILIVLLLLNTDKKNHSYPQRIFIAGIIAGALIKFQLFGFLVSWIFFGIYFLLKLITKKINIQRFAKCLFIFGLPSLLIGLVFVFSKVGGRSLINVFQDSFSWAPWQKHGAIWFIYFLAGNLGLGFLVYLVGFFFKRVWKNSEILAIYLTSFVITAIPLIMRFTIYEFDMLKFYYYLIPLICVLVAYFFANSKRKKYAISFFIVIAIISSFTSVNLLVHSFLNKNEGYSYADYETGIWIQNNIPEKSVFVTMPTVHSAPTDIGGRLRIISYINWPYSHGFNVGPDNVFSRVNDVTDVYKTGDIASVKVKYGADYVYYSSEERSQFPNAGTLFERNKNLKLIYNQNGIEIYKINQ
jgi:hypothetical protein